MRTLIIGGAASGKSEYAERLAVRHGGSLVYIATMEPCGEEAARRIARHRSQRAGKGFATAECHADLAKLCLEPRCTALLECLGNLAANELFAREKGEREALDAILGGMMRLEAQCAHLVVVSNDVFRDGRAYSRETEGYRRLLASLHSRLAERFDRVAEVVCGIPIWQKGSETP